MSLLAQPEPSTAEAPNPVWPGWDPGPRQLSSTRVRGSQAEGRVKQTYQRSCRRSLQVLLDGGVRGGEDGEPAPLLDLLRQVVDLNKEEEAEGEADPGPGRRLFLPSGRSGTARTRVSEPAWPAGLR